MPYVKIKPEPNPVMWYRNKVGYVFFARSYPHLSEFASMHGAIFSIDCYVVKPNIFQKILILLGFNKINVK